ncbi:MAG: zinc ribbon domain-containing protein [Thermomicrobiales bacterium]|jgi:RNA polymerase subunit RPABC4/transcription elongation factor Spt4|nr:zinc ribbon domain-containing protein [Thermomicrobiales bacterium]
MTTDAIIARAFQLLLALSGAYTVGIWFALVVWTFRDIESRSRSVIAQIFSTLVVVLFFIPGALIYLLLRPKETLDEAFGRALEEEYLLQDLEDLSLCPNCHHPLREDFVVCPHCYTELRHACPSCERLVDVSWAICPYCTTELVGEPADEEPAPAERPSLLPHPLRVLRERTEVRVQHSLDIVPPEEAPHFTGGENGTPIVARETHEAGAWSDEQGGAAWFLNRVREVFRPLVAGEPPHTNGHLPEDHDQNNGAKLTSNGYHADTKSEVTAVPPPPPVSRPARLREPAPDSADTPVHQNGHRPDDED